ncbi:MAG: hypothetical protein JWL58_7279 [Streptosporangiaceae bacterium]|jgi:hypothetical protein|nr:hypothetical protein [Streptosporangiaceae bacterium]
MTMRRSLVTRSPESGGPQIKTSTAVVAHQAAAQCWVSMPVATFTPAAMPTVPATAPPRLPLDSPLTALSKRKDSADIATSHRVSPACPGALPETPRVLPSKNVNTERISSNVDTADTHRAV